MYESLVTYTTEFHLFIFAFDEKSFLVLNKMNLERATIVSLADFETPELLEVKAGRSKGEYCWTCTPSAINHVLTRYHVPDCTYLDADLIFYSDPSVLIEEMFLNKKNVLITEHRYSALARLYEEKRAGRFCVQFVTFTRDQESLAVLDKWRLQCIDWCYARHEEGKFGDQKYLDEWPALYDNIHILEHPGGGVAPWNLQRYVFFEENGSIKGVVKKTKSSFQVVFFHFQYIKFKKNGIYDTGWYNIPKTVRKLFYLPYIKKIEEVERRILNHDMTYLKILTEYNTSGIRNLLKTGVKKFFGYNLLKTE
jgi:hypothetical protein